MTVMLRRILAFSDNVARPRTRAARDFPPPLISLSPSSAPALVCVCIRSGQLGATLTDLTTDQADYIGVAKGGPYKPATYRY